MGKERAKMNSSVFHEWPRREFQPVLNCATSALACVGGKQVGGAAVQKAW
jgi:hypothetical protein